LGSFPSGDRRRTAWLTSGEGLMRRRPSRRQTLARRSSAICSRETLPRTVLLALRLRPTVRLVVRPFTQTPAGSVEDPVGWTGLRTGLSPKLPVQTGFRRSVLAPTVRRRPTLPRGNPFRCLPCVPAEAHRPPLQTRAEIPAARVVRRRPRGSSVAFPSGDCASVSRLNPTRAGDADDSPCLVIVVTAT
jgi:hypothetical protein